MCPLHQDFAFLGRESPSAARAWGPIKSEADLSALKQSSKGVSSEKRSAHFAEYRQGRIPGSPGLDELRASANLGNAPSTVGVGSTRRTLFTSDVGASRGAKVSCTSQLEGELERSARIRLQLSGLKITALLTS